MSSRGVNPLSVEKAQTKVSLSLSLTSANQKEKAQPST